MSPTAPKTCNHDRGPGTAVCLRCRHDEYQAAQRRRHKLVLRGLALGGFVGMLGVIAYGAASSIRRRGAATSVQASAGPIALKQEGRPADSVASASRSPAAVTTSAVAVNPPGQRQQGTTAMIVSAGKTTLNDSVYALRTGDSVTVNFDAQGYRTRRPDKFERTIRETLPLIYGDQGAALMNSVPDGKLVEEKDLIGALATKGLHLTLRSGEKIAIWPRTRVGRDGPLVVSYLTLVER